MHALRTVTQFIMSSVRIFLVRHGETEYNASSTLQGQLDIVLNARGEAQARAASTYFAKKLGLPATALLMTSDLARAASTAESIAAMTGAAVRADSRLRETHLGAWQGSSWAAIDADSGPHGASAVHAWRSNPDTPAPGGGEATRARFARVAAALHEAALAAGVAHGGTAVCVSHGGAIDDGGRLALGTPWVESTRLRKANCCVCELSFTPRADVAAKMAVAGADPRAAATAAACLVAASPALAASTIEPHEARVALGEWTIVRWGIVEHLGDDADGAPLSDPLADNAHFSGPAEPAV